MRELRGIGPGIEAKLLELVETGEIAELRSLEAELDPALIGLGRMLGLSSQRTLHIARHLGVASVAEFMEAVGAVAFATSRASVPSRKRRSWPRSAASPLRRGD